jgi:hypothetical protein
MTPDVVFLARRLRWLTIYAGVLTLAVIAGAVFAATRPPQTRFGHIVVERVDVVEPGGMKRMVLTSAGRFPVDHRRDVAGMLFFNSDGIENGGLMINGGLTNGEVQHGVQLSMDRYHQYQTVMMRHSEGGGAYASGLYVQDRPTTPMPLYIAQYVSVLAMPEGPARDEVMAGFRRAAAPRVMVGRDRDESAQVRLADDHGRVRARLRVTKEGDARLEFLDEAGAVAASYPQSPPQ